MGRDITMGCVWEVIEMDEFIGVILKIAIGIVIVLAAIGWIGFIYQFIEGSGD